MKHIKLYAFNCKEFQICFWDLIKYHLLLMYNECIDKEEMTTTMNQGLMTLIPKPEKDPLVIENWRPVSLLNNRQILRQVTGEFSEASGLKLNTSNSEILSLYKTDEKLVFNIPVKQTVEYLGIHITKDIELREQLNFLPKVKKSIFNM